MRKKSGLAMESHLAIQEASRRGHLSRGVGGTVLGPESDFAQVRRHALQQPLVERFTRKHREFPPRHGNGIDRPQKKLFVIAHHIAERSIQRIGQNRHRGQRQRRGIVQNQLAPQPYAHLALGPGLVGLAKSGERGGFRAASAHHAGRKLVCDGGVRGIQTLELRVQVRSNDEGGELGGKQIERTESQDRQQDDRDDPDEHIGDNQPVAQTPEQLRLQPANCQNEEKKADHQAEAADPARQALPVGEPEQREQPLQCEKKNIERQQIPGDKRQLAGGKQAGLFQSQSQIGVA